MKANEAPEKIYIQAFNVSEEDTKFERKLYFDDVWTEEPESRQENIEYIRTDAFIAWLEKQGEQKPYMIQWKGDNLKEVLAFAGKDKNFERWFKSFEEYEKYVYEHNNIFKLFNEDGSHYEVPVGAWIVKTPDGYNVASKAVLKQKPAWSEEDEERIKNILSVLDVQVCWNGATGKKENPYQKEIDWLKSLKDRYTWKPSDEQINILFKYAEQNNKDGSILISLYQELKKLRKG